MKDIEINPQIVQELYRKYKNQQYFIICFGTKKFHLVDKQTLIKMYNFLVKKVKP